MKSTLKRQQLAGQSAGAPSRQLRNIIFFFLFLELSFFMTSYESRQIRTYKPQCGMTYNSTGVVTASVVYMS